MEQVCLEEKVENEAEYALERAVRCPHCGAEIQAVHVVRILRTRVNFTSNLPRRGFAILCSACDSILSANIGTRVL